MLIQYVIARHLEGLEQYRTFDGNWTDQFLAAYRYDHPHYIYKNGRLEESQYIARVVYDREQSKVIRSEYMRQAPCTFSEVFQDLLFKKAPSQSTFEQMEHTICSLQQSLENLLEDPTSFARYIDCFQYYIELCIHSSVDPKLVGLPGHGLIDTTDGVLLRLINKSDRVLNQVERSGDTEYILFLFSDFLLLGIQRFDYTIGSIVQGYIQQFPEVLIVKKSIHFMNKVEM